MFRNYYQLMNVASNASDEDINVAIEQSNLSPLLLEEIKMVLLNKSLKALYDDELQKYEISCSKQDYEIVNPVLDRELKKVRAYISRKARITIKTKSVEPKRKTNAWLWTLIIVLIICLAKCGAAYYKGKRKEEIYQKYFRSDYDNISTKRPILGIPHLFKPMLK